MFIIGKYNKRSHNILVESVKRVPVSFTIWARSRIFFKTLWIIFILIVIGVISADSSSCNLVENMFDLPKLGTNSTF